MAGCGRKPLGESLNDLRADVDWELRQSEEQECRIGRARPERRNEQAHVALPRRIPEHTVRTAHPNVSPRSRTKTANIARIRSLLAPPSPSGSDPEPVPNEDMST